MEQHIFLARTIFLCNAKCYNRNPWVHYEPQINNTIIQYEFQYSMKVIKDLILTKWPKKWQKYNFLSPKDLLKTEKRVFF
jgi:hypothetical protein